MTPEGKIGLAQTLSRLISAVLLLAVGPAGWAQEVSPALLQAARAAYQQEQQKEAQTLPPAEVDPRLVGEKVEVYYRDGRTLKGKLVQLTPDFIQLERQGQIEQIPRSEVTRVSRRQGTGRRVWIIVGVSAAAVGVLLLLTARYWEE